MTTEYSPVSGTPEPNQLSLPSLVPRQLKLSEIIQKSHQGNLVAFDKRVNAFDLFGYLQWLKTWE